MFELNSFNKENNCVILIAVNQNDIKAFKNCNLKHFNVYIINKNLRFVIFNKH